MTEEMPDWERRFRTPRVGLPDWARDRPDRAAVVATANGVLEVHSWDHSRNVLVQATRRKEGTAHATIDPAGEWLWWFDDGDGDEFGVWRRQPFGSGPDADLEDPTGLPGAYPSGLAIGRDGLVVVGRAYDDYGAQIHVVTPGAPARLLYEHTEDAGVGDLSEDGELVAISHSEHGDSRHPALRVVRAMDGTAVGELWDGPGKGLDAYAFAPVAGDTRLLVGHERRGRPELLIWDVATGEQQELELDVPGEISDADWFLDATALLVAVDHDAAPACTATTSPAAPPRRRSAPAEGSVRAATTRPDGDVWMSWSSAAQPPSVRDLAGDVVLAPPGDPAPASVPVEDVWVDGPGGPIHALLRRPAGSEGTALPLIVDVHGGPTHHDADVFRAGPAAWVDHGFAVVQVNYRGSTGYGSAWRDALEARIGHVELEDVVAVRDHLVAAGVADGGRVGAGRRVVGRVPDAARARGVPGPVGARPGRRPGRGLCGCVRGRDGGAEGLRPVAVRGVARGGARQVPGLQPADVCRRRPCAGADPRRGERPAVPDPADRELRAGARGARDRARGVPVRRRPRVARRRRGGPPGARRVGLHGPPPPTHPAVIMQSRTVT